MESRRHDDDDRHDPKSPRVSTHPLPPMKQFAALLPKSDTGRPHSGCHYIPSIVYQSCLLTILGACGLCMAQACITGLPAALLAEAGGCGRRPRRSCGLQRGVRPTAGLSNSRSHRLPLCWVLAADGFVVTFFPCAVVTLGWGEPWHTELPIAVVDGRPPTDVENHGPMPREGRVVCCLIFLHKLVKRRSRQLPCSVVRSMLILVSAEAYPQIYLEPCPIFQAILRPNLVLFFDIQLLKGR